MYLLAKLNGFSMTRSNLYMRRHGWLLLFGLGFVWLHAQALWAEYLPGQALADELAMPAAMADRYGRYDLLVGKSWSLWALQQYFDAQSVSFVYEDMLLASLSCTISVFWGWVAIGLMLAGGLGWMWSQADPAGHRHEGVWQQALTSRGWPAMLLGAYLVLTYVLLYWSPVWLAPLIRLAEPVSMTLTAHHADQWSFYGMLYTAAVAVMGLRMWRKYADVPYQRLRTLSVVFFQTTFAFLLPGILYRFNLPAQDLKNIFPLDYSFFFDYRLDQLMHSGLIGWWMLGWGVVLFVVVVPVMTWRYGKRWYCSWVCGCGGLAETAGDPFRHLSDKSLRAWQAERWIVHSVLVWVLVMTAGVLYTYLTGADRLWIFNTYDMRQTYGFVVGAGFAGVVGTGFYPLMGNRVWCRFGCPLAAYLGIVQRLHSRYRITTNGGQCISCGQCSTFCEMGIDVRWYAQRGQDIVRASCVGCGVCATVCPRGVLKLENSDLPATTEPGPILIGHADVQLYRSSAQ